MRSHTWTLLGTALVVQAQTKGQHLARERAVTVAAPDCSLTCLATLVPEYCGSLTNLTCICESTDLTAAITQVPQNPRARFQYLPPPYESLSLRLQRFSAESCNVPNDQSRTHEQKNVAYVLPAIVVLCVVARIYIRTKLEAGLGADDWMMVTALISYLAMTSTALAIPMYGFGQHTYWLESWQVEMSLMFFYISEVLYMITLTLTKLSLLLFFRRIFPDARLRRATWAVFVFIILSNFSIIVALMFQCLPIHDSWTNWKYKVAPIKCINTSACSYVASVFSIVHDLLILALPLPTLWHLNLPRKKKLHLLAMFSIGLFVILCSLLRLPSLMKLNRSSDPSWDEAPIVVWSQLEVGAGIICGCLPAIRSLVGWCFPRLKMSLADSRITPPSYPPTTRSTMKSDRKRHDSQLATFSGAFLELRDRIGNPDDLEGGEGGLGSIVSHESQTVFHQQLVPNKGENGFGRSKASVAVTAIEDPRVKKGDFTGIVYKTTVEQSSHHMA